MTREDIINTINKSVEFLTNGSVNIYGRTYNGHPAFYIKHSKDDFDKELEAITSEKKSFDRYDLYYYTNYMFKYMLGEYDAHTRMLFTDRQILPIKIRIINDVPYIVDSIGEYSQYNGAEIIGINNINIDTIITELKKIICYPSNEFLKIELEKCLSDINVIKSLPIVDSSSEIKLITRRGEIHFDAEDINKYVDKNIKPNYNLEIDDNTNTAIITYNMCSEEEKMIELVDKLKENKQINNYIVDLRGNVGGNSAINDHLIDFLKEKNVIVLCDERVFSSAIMCAIDLKKNGAKLIGAAPGTTISHFGNNVMYKRDKDKDLIITGSATYWYYDDDLLCKGIYKEDFQRELNDNPRLLEHNFLNVDEIVTLSLDDYINNNDSVLNYALSLFSKEESKRIL